MRAVTSALTAGLLSFMSSCVAVADDDDEVRRVSGLEFDGVVVVGDIEVEISQGDTCELQLRGDPDDLDKEPFYLSKGQLIVGKSRRGSTRFDDDLRVRVFLPELRDLRLKGSGKAYVRAFEAQDAASGPAKFSLDGSGDVRIYAYRGRSLRLDVRGSGDFKVADLEVEDLKALVSGSGDLFIRRLTAEAAEFVVTGSGDLRITEGGHIDEVEVSVIGSGDADLDDLSTDLAEVNVVGSGSVDMGEVRKALSASILGSGDVYYSGDPVVDKTAFGSGEVRQRR